MGGRFGGSSMSAVPEQVIADLIERAEPVDAGEPTDLKAAGLSQRDALLEVCDRAEVWRTPEGETLATVEVAGHLEHHAIQSRGFRDWMLGELARRYRNAGRPASATESAVRDARMALEARGHHCGTRRNASLRVGEHGDRVYIDLGTPDWRAVEVGQTGWRVVAGTPVPLIRTRRTAPFPEPLPGEGWARLRRPLSHLSADDYILFLSWCLGALLPAGPYPILILGGEQGSGKSTLARLAQRLTDPVAGDLLQPPGNDRDLIAAARNNRVLAFDNFSGIRADLADSLCRLATGSEIGGRALYSDHETATFSASRPLILNGIPDLAARGDLADRAVVLRLQAPGQRMTERDWAAEVDRLLPATFADLLNGLSLGLRRLAETPTPDVRMADFARFVVAAEPVLPWPRGAFLSAYRRNRGQAIAALAEGDPVAQAVRKFIENRSSSWHGLVSALFDILTPSISIEARRSGDWPGNARWFSDRLRRAGPALRALGIDVAEKRGGHGLNVAIRKIASLDTSATPAASPEVGPPDANVASDANSPLSKATADPASAAKPMTSVDWQADYDERAGILEFDGGLDREAAELAAAKDIGPKQSTAEASGG
jgi:hypothetical protein